MIGTYTCLVPPLYLYSIGNVFRAGVEGRYRRSPWLIAGYFFIAFAYAYWLLFPIGLFVMLVFWTRLFRNIPKPPVQPDECP